METLTFEQLIGAAVVILILVGAYNTIMSAVKTHREEEKLKNSPIEQLKERLDKHDRLFENDKTRLEALTRATEDLAKVSEQQDKGISVLMRASLAQCRHMQHGNNIDGLRASETEITNFLTGK